MSYSLSSVINDFSNNMCENPGMLNLTRNIVVVVVIINLLIALIYMNLGVAQKPFVISLLLSSLILFIHHNSCKKYYKKMLSTSDITLIGNTSGI